MSGGVDSSVAAHLLVEQGHEVIGVFMRHGEQSPAACGGEQGAGARSSGCSPLHHKQGCCTASDADDARRVADKLGIPFYALNLQAEFVQIIDYFVSEYTAGRTPNPCVQCNNWIKFGKLFDYADSVGAEFVATGHYARLETLADGSTALLRGVDAAKDQSYVLFGIRSRVAAAHDVAGGTLREAGDPPDGGRFGFARCRQEGQPGNLFRYARAIRRVCAAASRQMLIRPANWLRPTARWSASTRESKALRSGSGRAWASRSASGSLWCGLSRSRGGW